MKIINWLLIIVTCILFTVLVFLTPLWGDDYTYIFCNSPDNLRSFYNEILPANWYTNNFAGVSRFIPHLLIGLFHYLGKWSFNIISGFMFILFGLTSARIVTRQKDLILPLTLISCALLFFIINGFYKIGIWLSGAPNYLYISIFVGVFYIILTEKIAISKHKIINSISLFFIGFITGWTNEGFIVGLTIALIIYYLILHREELTSNRQILIGGFFLGGGFLCLSPFNVSRFLTGHSDVSLLYSVVSAIINFNNIRVIPILLLCLLFFSLIFCKSLTRGNFIKSYIKDNLILVFALIFSVIFIIFTKHSSNYSRFPCEFYAMLLLLELMLKLLRQFLNLISILCGLGMIISLCYILPTAYKSILAYKNIEMQIKNGQSIIISEPVELNEFEERYIVPPQHLLYPHSVYMHWDINHYYKNESNPYIISRPIYEELKKEKAPHKRNWNKNWKASYISIPLTATIDKITMILNPVDFGFLSFPQRLYAPYFDRYKLNKIENVDFQCITIDNNQWVIVPDNPLVIDRLKQIKIEYWSGNDSTLYSVKY
ncbi:MAG: hypothetical protein J1E57_10880 [Prevotella sp.]|nr:hypothetical protein [Prevotella sp.]